MSVFKDNYERALWAIANGTPGEPVSSKDEASVLRGIAQEALGDKWAAFLAEVEGTPKA